MVASLLKNCASITWNLSRSFIQCPVWMRHSVVSVLSTSSGSITKCMTYHLSILNTFKTQNILTRYSLPHQLSSGHFANSISNHWFHVEALKQSRCYSSSSQEHEEDDLKAILKDKSLSISEKFKIIFKQYGLVMVVVHLLTSAVWIFIFYQAISRYVWLGVRVMLIYQLT